MSNKNSLDSILEMVPNHMKEDQSELRLYVSPLALSWIEDLITDGKYKGYTVMVENEAAEESAWISFDSEGGSTNDFKNESKFHK